MISVLIPTLNNVAHLRLAVEALRRNSVETLEILVHANAASDEMIEYLSCADVDTFTTSKENLGVAAPANSLAKLAAGDFIFYLGDDAYVAPGWDTAFLSKVNDAIPGQYLTACMFEPQYENMCMNSPSTEFGTTLQTFNTTKFDNDWRLRRRITHDIVSPWGPIFITAKLWNAVGGFDEGYYPGFGTDPDFVAEVLDWSKRTGSAYEFRGVADCGIFHFQCITTNTLPQHYRVEAQQRFVAKWGLNPAELHALLKAGTPLC